MIWPSIRGIFCYVLIPRKRHQLFCKGIGAMRKYIPFVLAIAFTIFVKVQGANAGVAAGDTFTFDVAGLSGNGSKFFTIAQGTATFGTPDTFTDPDGQTITLNSSESESITDGTTTDTFTISTPTNFLTGKEINGTTIKKLEFDIGNDVSGGNPVNFSSPISGETSAGTVDFDANRFVQVNPNTTLSTNGESVSSTEDVATADNGPIYNKNVTSFTDAITYNTTSGVPEPSSLAIVGGCMLCALRRRPARPMPHS